MKEKRKTKKEEDDENVELLQLPQRTESSCHTRDANAYVDLSGDSAVDMLMLMYDMKVRTSNGRTNTYTRAHTRRA